MCGRYRHPAAWRRARVVAHLWRVTHGGLPAFARVRRTVGRSRENMERVAEMTRHKRHRPGNEHRTTRPRTGPQSQALPVGYEHIVALTRHDASLFWDAIRHRHDECIGIGSPVGSCAIGAPHVTRKLGDENILL